MKLIRFSQGCSPYVPGDIASFEDKLAEKYVEKGYGKIVTQRELKSEKPKVVSAEAEEDKASDDQDDSEDKVPE